MDFCALSSDCGSDRRGARIEGFERPPFEVFGYSFTPVDDGAEDLSRVRLGIRKKKGLACVEEQCFWRGLLAVGAHISVLYSLHSNKGDSLVSMGCP